MIAVRWAALLAAAPLLSGCVAAALPVLAAGGVLRTQADGQSPAERSPPRVAVDIAPQPASSTGSSVPGTLAKNYTLADGTRMEVMAGPLPGPQNATLAAAPPGVASQVSSAEPTTGTLTDGTRVQIVGGALPAPSGPGLGPTGFASYDPFYGYTLDQGTRPVTGSERKSALLAEPGKLAAETRMCSIHPAAVLIDLDPGSQVLDPTSATHADARLTGTLAALRAQGLTIGWITGATADRAGAIRRALIGSGLDPVGRDELALLRYPEERKQTRREDFAKQYCVVAIAGDERGDFDELFQYLKDPSVAAPLEALVGKGWFLIPQPLS